MAAQENPLDLDELLAVTPSDVPEEEEQDAPDPETSEQKYIRELEEALARPAPEPQEEDEEDFVPTSKLSPEQQRIRELEDQLTRKLAAEAESAAPRYDTTPAKGETILLHFLVDGFTAAGVIWYRGQEVEFVVGSEAYKQQFDRNGKSWLDLLDDPSGQYKRYGQQYYARGPWPGRAWDDDSNLSPEEAAAAKVAAEAERRRGRRAPLIG